MRDITVYIVAVALMSAGALLCRPSSGKGKRLYGPFAFRALDMAKGLAAASPLGGIKKKLRREATDREIFEAISFLRNLIAADKGGVVSADTLLEHLASKEGALSHEFAKSLSLLRVNKKDEMIRYFSEAGDTPMSRDFIRMIVGWDNVSPDKLSGTLLSYQNTMKELRTTELKRRNEVLSDLVFFPVIANVMLVFMNFIYIVYFIGQQDMLRNIFG